MSTAGAPALRDSRVGFSMLALLNQWGPPEVLTPEVGTIRFTEHIINLRLVPYLPPPELSDKVLRSAD